jgi:phosphomannomutase
VVRLDGVKWVGADGSWALVRPSGTEPVARVYVEGRSRMRLAALREWAGGFTARLKSGS